MANSREKNQTDFHIPWLVYERIMIIYDCVCVYIYILYKVIVYSVSLYKSRELKSITKKSLCPISLNRDKIKGFYMVLSRHS